MKENNLEEVKVIDASCLKSSPEDAKTQARYLKFQIIELAAEIEGVSAQTAGGTPKIESILKTADAIADFVFSEFDEVEG